MYVMTVRTTHALVAVAHVLMDDSAERHWGYDLSKRSGIRSGVMYPILGRMLDEGWLEDGWEDQTQLCGAKRPPRRYYELTAEGKVALGALLAKARRDMRFNRWLGRPAVGGIG